MAQKGVGWGGVGGLIHGLERERKAAAAGRRAVLPVASDLLSSTWFPSDGVFNTLKHALIKNPQSASPFAAINMLDHPVVYHR